MPTKLSWHRRGSRRRTGVWNRVVVGGLALLGVLALGGRWVWNVPIRPHLRSHREAVQPQFWLPGSLGSVSC